MTQILSVRLNATQRRKLEAKATASGATASELVRQWVDSLEAGEVSWDAILAEVRLEAARPGPRIPNRVLAERRKRRLHERVR